jgi:hypothetical protein
MIGDKMDIKDLKKQLDSQKEKIDELWRLL